MRGVKEKRSVFIPPERSPLYRSLLPHFQPTSNPPPSQSTARWYCPILSHTKNRDLRRKTGQKIPGKTLYYPEFSLYYPVKAGKMGNPGPYRARITIAHLRPPGGYSPGESQAGPYSQSGGVSSGNTVSARGFPSLPISTRPVSVSRKNRMFP